MSIGRRALRSARLRLTTKQVNGGYYKGTRTGSMGFFGPKKGQYFIDYRKVRTYVVPEDLSSFKLTPFVTRKMDPTLSPYTKDIVNRHGETIKKPAMMSGMQFLEMCPPPSPEDEGSS